MFFFCQVAPHPKPIDYIFPAFAMFICFNQIWLLCLFGQRLTSQFDELLELSYDCLWYEQSTSFKKKLLLMRTVCIKQMKLKTIVFPLSFESFYKVNHSISVFVFYLINIYSLDCKLCNQQFQISTQDNKAKSEIVSLCLNREIGKTASIR